MKKMQILIMITISLLLSYNFGFSQVVIEPKEIDPFLSTIERLKEEGDFENWPCKNGPVKAGIILSKDDFSALQEAEDDTFMVTDDTLSNEELIFKWKATKGDVYIDEPDQYYYSSEKEGLHTISFLLSSKDTGIITEERINIMVDDDRKIDERFLDFLLTDEEIPEYSIESIIPGHWPVGPDASVDRVDQQWETSSGKPAAVIILAIFDSEEAAIRATYYYTNPTQSI